MAGRPRGAWSDKAWRDAIRQAVNVEGPDGRKKLLALADTLISSAMAGDVSALKEIGDRLDGKVPQALIGGSEEDAPIAVQFIELRAVRANDPSD